MNGANNKPSIQQIRNKRRRKDVTSIHKFFDVEIDGRKGYYKLRKYCFYYLGIVNFLIVVAAYYGVLSAGHGYTRFSDNVLIWLIVAGTLENGLTFCVTLYLFSDRPSPFDMFRKK